MCCINNFILNEIHPSASLLHTAYHMDRVFLQLNTGTCGSLINPSCGCTYQSQWPLPGRILFSCRGKAQPLQETFNKSFCSSGLLAETVNDQIPPDGKLVKVYQVVLSSQS